MQISATDTTCFHANEQLIRTWSGVWHTAHSKAGRGIDDHSTHRRFILFLFLRDDNRFDIGRVLLRGLEGLLRFLQWIATRDERADINAPTFYQRNPLRIGIGVAECPTGCIPMTRAIAGGRNERIPSVSAC